MSVNDLLGTSKFEQIQRKTADAVDRKKDREAYQLEAEAKRRQSRIWKLDKRCRHLEEKGFGNEKFDLVNDDIKEVTVFEIVDDDGKALLETIYDSHSDLFESLEEAAHRREMDCTGCAPDSEIKTLIGRLKTVGVNGLLVNFDMDQKKAEEYVNAKFHYWKKKHSREQVEKWLSLLASLSHQPEGNSIPVLKKLKRKKEMPEPQKPEPKSTNVDNIDEVRRLAKEEIRGLKKELDQAKAEIPQQAKDELKKRQAEIDKFAASHGPNFCVTQADFTEVKSKLDACNAALGSFALNDLPEIFSEYKQWKELKQEVLDRKKVILFKDARDNLISREEAKKETEQAVKAAKQGLYTEDELHEHEDTARQEGVKEGTKGKMPVWFTVIVAVSLAIIFFVIGGAVGYSQRSPRSVEATEEAIESDSSLEFRQFEKQLEL